MILAYICSGMAFVGFLAFVILLVCWTINIIKYTIKWWQTPAPAPTPTISPKPISPEVKAEIISAAVAVGFWSIIFSVFSFPIALLIMFISGQCNCGKCCNCQ